MQETKSMSFRKGQVSSYTFPAKSPGIDQETSEGSIHVGALLPLCLVDHDTQMTKQTRMV
jgi:hypothetical protein